MKISITFRKIYVYFIVGDKKLFLFDHLHGLGSISRKRLIYVYVSLGFYLGIMSSMVQAQSGRLLDRPLLDFPRPEIVRRELVRAGSKVVRLPPTLNQIQLSTALGETAKAAASASSPSPFVNLPAFRIVKREMIRAESQVVRVTPTLSEVQLNIASVSTAKVATPASVLPTLFNFTPPVTVKRELIRTGL